MEDIREALKQVARQEISERLTSTQVIGRPATVLEDESPKDINIKIGGRPPSVGNEAAIGAAPAPQPPVQAYLRGRERVDR